MHDWTLSAELMAKVLAAKGYHYQLLFASGTSRSVALVAYGRRNFRRRSAVRSVSGPYSTDPNRGRKEMIRT